jgi:tetratricopeptide (TPR) repeat protein
MTRLGDGLVVSARAAGLALVLALPWFAGYMFIDRICWATLAVMVIALLVCAAVLLGAREVQRGLGGIGWLLGGFLAWNALAVARSVYLHAGLVTLGLFAGIVVAPALFASLFRDRRWRWGGWAAVAVAGALEGVIGLRDWTQTVIFGGDVGWRIFGTMFNPNVLAGYLLATIPAGLVALVLAGRSSGRDDRPRLGLIGAGFALLVMGAALLLTGSRAGLIGAVLGAATMLVTTPIRVNRRTLVGVAVALVALMALAPPVRDRIVSAATQSHSALFRWYTWRGTARMIAARPLLGFGPGSFELAYPQYAEVGFTRMAHQTPLQLAAEAGLPAVILMTLAVALLARMLVRGARAGGPTAIEATAGVGALTALGVQNLADYTWYIPAVGITLSAVTGLALAAVRAAEDEAHPAPAARGPGWYRTGIALTLGVLIACAVGLRAQMLAARGRAELARGRYATAAGWLRQAAEIDPLDAEILADLAQATAAAGPGGVQRAVELRLRVAELNPLQAGNYLALALLYQAADRDASALAAARRAVEVAPNWPVAWAALGRLQEALGRHEEALETWRALDRIAQSPVGRYQAVLEPTDIAFAWAWLALGKQAEAEGEHEVAAGYYKRAAELAETFASIQRSREEGMRALGTWDEAETVEAEKLRDEARAGLERVGDTAQEREVS